MGFPKLRVRSLMIAVGIVGVLFAGAIQIRRSLTPAELTVTVVDETGAAGSIDRFSFALAPQAVVGSCLGPSMSKGTVATLSFPTVVCSPGDGVIRVDGHTVAGHSFSGSTKVRLVGGMRSHVRCQFVRRDAGVAAIIGLVGRPTNVLRPWDYGMTMVAFAFLLTPVALVAALFGVARSLWRNDAKYLNVLRRSSDRPETCPWPPESPPMQGPP